MTTILMTTFIFSIAACIAGLFLKNKKLIYTGLALIGLTILAFWGLLNLISCM